MQLQFLEGEVLCRLVQYQKIGLEVMYADMFSSSIFYLFTLYVDAT